MKHGLIYVHGEITRLDPENRIVEGYCFVNESVGKGKAKISRRAMEEATQEYLRWGCLREMHGANAAGTANNGTPELGVTWDDTGAYYRSKVIDDDAWKKCEEKVYKGFSVGVKPLVMRGGTVEKCEWVEVSLVDRPADPDARLTIARADDYNGETEFDVVEEQEAEVRGAFKEGIADMEKSALRNAAWYRLDSVLWSIQHGESNDKASLIRQACSEFADYIAPIIARGEFGTNELFLRLESVEPNPEILQRAESVDGLTTRAETAEAEVTRLQTAFDGRGELIQRLATVIPIVEDEEESAMVARAVELLGKPVTEQPPMRVTAEGLVERLIGGDREAEATRREAVEKELAEITRTDWTKKTEPEKQSAFLRVQELKTELAQ